jgi:cobalamin biosynthetic protein CobC
MTGPNDMADVTHGGNLDDASLRYGTPEGGWLDLSTGINPHAYPLPDLPAGVWTALPTAAAEAALCAAAQGAYGAKSPDNVVAAPGTQALIQAIPRVLGHDRAAIVGPTYGEYLPAWRAAGADVHTASDLEGAVAALDGARNPALVLCNPNNPDGRTFDPARLIALADRHLRTRGTLVVDEAFADVVPEISLAGRSDRPAVIVLRSFGKFFGLAGVRLGFALCGTGTRAYLRTALGPWAVPGPAIAIGRTALADLAWQDATRRRLADDRARLDELLTHAGFEVLGGTPLYRLAHHADAQGWHDRLARHGVWTRPFPHAQDRLRFGLPGTEDGWARLGRALGLQAG